MRKLIFPILVGTLMMSCSKKEAIKEETKADSVHVETPVAETPAVQNSGLQEVTSEQLSELLKTKNDTLYITNFFATWCPPCIKEIPHFTEKMEQLKSQPVKFTFVDLDNKTDWDTTVNVFVDEHKIRKNTILLDGSKLTPTFFSDNFKTWTGETIPFTHFRKGDQTKEVNGMVSQDQLEEILNSLK